MSSALATEASGADVQQRSMSSGLDGRSKASHQSPRRDEAATPGQPAAPSNNYIDAREDMGKQYGADGSVYPDEAENEDRGNDGFGSQDSDEPRQQKMMRQADDYEDERGGAMDGAAWDANERASPQSGVENEGSMSSYSGSSASSDNNEAAAVLQRQQNRKQHLKKRGRNIGHRFSAFFHRLAHRSSSASSHAHKTPKRPHSSPEPERRRSTFFSRWRWRRRHGEETRSESSGEGEEEEGGEYGQDDVMVYEEGGASGWDSRVMQQQQQQASAYNEADVMQPQDKPRDAANANDTDDLDRRYAEMELIAYVSPRSTPQALESNPPTRSTNAEHECQSEQDDAVERGMAQYDDGRIDDGRIDGGHADGGRVDDDDTLSPISLSSGEWDVSLEETARPQDAFPSGTAKPGHYVDSYAFPTEEGRQSQVQQSGTESARAAATQGGAPYGGYSATAPNSLAMVSPVSQPKPAPAPGPAYNEGGIPRLQGVHAGANTQCPGQFAGAAQGGGYGQPVTSREVGMRPAPQYQVATAEKEQVQRRLSGGQAARANEEAAEAARQRAMQQQQQYCQPQMTHAQTAPPCTPQHTAMPPRQSWIGSGYPQMWPMAAGQQPMLYPSYSQYAMNPYLAPQMSMSGVPGQFGANARGAGRECSMYMPYGSMGASCMGSMMGGPVVPWTPVAPGLQMMMQQEQQRLFGLQMQQQVLMEKQRQYIAQRLTALDGGAPGSQYHGGSGHSRMGFKPTEYREAEEKRVKEQEESLSRSDSGSSGSSSGDSSMSSN